MVELTAKLLGTPQVLFEGREIVLPYKKADALLYFLILSRKAFRSELTGLLWTDSDSTTALKNLRHAAYSIRKAIGYNLFAEGQRSVLELAPEIDIHCDVQQFEDGDILGRPARGPRRGGSAARAGPSPPRGSRRPAQTPAQRCRCRW